MAFVLEGVLFDLDGVLLDTEGDYTLFWESVDRLYPTHVDNFAQVIKGSNLETILNTYFDKNDHEAVVELLNSHQDEMRYVFFPGAVQLLQRLNREGVRCCLVTSSDYRKMDAVFAAHPWFRDCFQAIVTGNMVSQPKPSPECFLLGAEKIGCDIAHCVVIEDSLNGIQAGVDSGAKVIALATTLPRASLEGKAHLLFDSIAELVEREPLV